MKKLIVCFTLLSMLLFAGVAHALNSYTLDINIPNQSSVNSAGIGMVSFNVLGGTYTYQFGNAVPSAGNWIFEKYGGGWASIYDNYTEFPVNESAIAPLKSGNIVTITSAVPLTFAGLSFTNYNGDVLNPSFYSTKGFQASVAPEPVSMALVGSGLIVLPFFRRIRGRLSRSA